MKLEFKRAFATVFAVFFAFSFAQGQHFSRMEKLLDEEPTSASTRVRVLKMASCLDSTLLVAAQAGNSGTEDVWANFFTRFLIDDTTTTLDNQLVQRAWANALRNTESSVRFGKLEEKIDLYQSKWTGFAAAGKLKIGQLSYTPDLRKSGVEGEVIVVFVYATSGIPTNISFISYPHPELKNLVHAWLQKQKSTPAKLKGKPVSVYKAVRTTFEIN